jgi:hypothetical protein
MAFTLHECICKPKSWVGLATRSQCRHTGEV